MHVSGMITGMDTVTRAQRAHNADTVLLQARVSPEARTAFKAAAKRSGVSVAFYMEKLILQLERDGALPVITHPRHQEELPIPAA